MGHALRKHAACNKHDVCQGIAEALKLHASAAWQHLYFGSVTPQGSARKRRSATEQRKRQTGARAHPHVNVRGNEVSSERWAEGEVAHEVGDRGGSDRLQET